MRKLAKFGFMHYSGHSYDPLQSVTPNIEHHPETTVFGIVERIGSYWTYLFWGRSWCYFMMFACAKCRVIFDQHPCWRVSCAGR